MPPRITYDTTGATAGTEINFTEPPEWIRHDYETEKVKMMTDNGVKQTVNKYIEHKITVKYNYETDAIKAAYELFFTTCAANGEEFLFWPTAAENSTYYTMTLDDADLRIRRYSITTPDRHGWTHTYRRTT